MEPKGLPSKSKNVNQTQATKPINSKAAYDNSLKYSNSNNNGRSILGQDFNNERVSKIERE